MTPSFPTIPSFQASWRSLQYEPILFSGERITVAVIVQGKDGSLLVVKTLDGRSIKKLFGSHYASKVKDALTICVSSAERHYKGRLLSEEWRPPFEGFFINSENVAVADRIDEIVCKAIKYSSVFGAISQERVDREEVKRANLTADTWYRNVKELLIKRRSSLSEYFDCQVPLVGSGVPTEFGVLSPKYAAQFDIVATSRRSRVTGLVRAQSKLWQLDQLRDADLMFKPNKYELVIQTPNEIETSGAKDNYQDYVDEIRLEADRREIKVYTANNAATAAEYLNSQIAA